MTCTFLKDKLEESTWGANLVFKLHILLSHNCIFKIYIYAFAISLIQNTKKDGKLLKIRI